MSVLGNVLVGIAIFLGIGAAIVQVIPSALIICLALLVWAIIEGGVFAWTVFGVGTLILLASTFLKYLIPGKRLLSLGTPRRTLILSAVAAVAGWFLIPVVGFLAAGIATLYYLERQRLGTHQAARDATVDVLKSLGLIIAIELVAALTVATLWVVCVIFA
ncbi:DUF456 domain-containing protein [Schaalia suimastitidis]|uniref:DUF456 domain-containing protein n=1 Tax=Schaalia suimastitidis TaxID=121163 RepID=UPI0004118BEC|nr:DUF456 domain-containing protein [Schaalia suimastitidis]